MLDNTPRFRISVCAAALLLGACAGQAPEYTTDAAAGAPQPAPLQVPPQAPGAAPKSALADHHAGRMALEQRQATARRQQSEMAAAGARTLSAIRPAAEAVDRDNYAHYEDASVKRVADQPVSTFSADVDTAAYANLRRFVMSGQRPPSDAVRIEEMLNYFSYSYPPTDAAQHPFSLHTELAPSPWNPHTHLLQVGVRAADVALAELPPANLVFLVDVSGSMQSADKLPLLKQSLRLLVQRLRPQDSLALVVYAGASGVVLEPTAGDQKSRIMAALEALSAGGSTNGAAGIRLAYQVATQAFRDGGINRVILATDGDFNVGTVNQQALVDLVQAQKQRGIALSVLGLGRGNYNDALMEELSNRGDGNAAYIDSLKEANKVLVREMGGTLLTLASDMKIQIEFNPAAVAEYRLIGYENRRLQRQDFNNDKVDAGDIGAGHTVTALYEIRLADRPGSLLEPLRYQTEPDASAGRHGDELAFLRLRYKRPGEQHSRLLEQSVSRSRIAHRFELASDDLRFAAAVAGYGQWLRGGRYLQAFDAGTALSIARAARGADPNGERAEFVQLVDLSLSLD